MEASVVETLTREYPRIFEGRLSTVHHIVILVFHISVKVIRIVDSLGRLSM